MSETIVTCLAAFIQTGASAPDHRPGMRCQATTLNISYGRSESGDTMKLVDAQTMRSIDQTAINSIGIPGVVLMESAGRAVADAVLSIAASHGTDRVLVVCGPGNNGGDGFVAARHLIDSGLEVVVVLLVGRSRYVGDALTNLKALDWFGATVVEAPSGIPDNLVAWAADAVVVDAIFGTGLVRPVGGVFADTIDILNTLQGPAVAVDIPSGIDPDTGRVAGTAFEADVTVTFGAARIGHYVWPGRGHCGDITVAPIGIPRALIERAPGATLLQPADICPGFLPRHLDSFKNSFGHVAVIGGMPGRTGAAILAGRASLRAGAGLATVVTCDVSASRIDGSVPDLMVEPAFRLTDGDSGRGPWVGCEIASIHSVLRQKSAVVLGPGLGLLPGTESMIGFVLDAGLPAVIDADALNILAAGRLDMPGASCILTPHPGEAARLQKTDSGTIQAGRLDAAREIAGKTGATTVLKGAGTIIANPDGRLAICDLGTPALAVAGSGDVLSGIAGALLARGIPPFDAACWAVTVHAIAGRVASRRFGEHGTTASDLVDSIPDAVLAASRGYDGTTGDSDD